MTKLKMLGVLLAGVFLTLGWTTGTMTAATALSKTAPKNITGIWISGNDRYDIAVKISEVGWPEGTHFAVLASGKEGHLIDALLAAPLAAVRNAPILLTDGEFLNPQTKEQLKRMNVSNVYIVGGETIMTPMIRQELLNLGMTPVRLGGKDRTETAINIARELGPSAEVFVVNADAAIDGLMAASIASLKGAPILLTYYDHVPTSIREYIHTVQDGISQSVIIGGSRVIPEEIEEDFPLVRRVGGTDRYDTNSKILQEFNHLFQTDSVFIGSGEDGHLTDLLSVSALASQMASPVILRGSSGPKGLGQSERVKELIQRYAPSKIIILGGEQALSEGLLESLALEGVVFGEMLTEISLDLLGIRGSLNSLDSSTHSGHSGNSSESPDVRDPNDGNDLPKVPPGLNNPAASVDAPFSYTFLDNPDWREKIAEVKINEVMLATDAYTTAVPGQMTFYPGQSPLLQQSGIITLEIIASGYETVLLEQTLQAGAATALELTKQPIPPATSGELFAVQPEIKLLDQYGNLCAAGVSANAELSATPLAGSGDWELGGTTSVRAAEGVIRFTDLSVIQESPGTGFIHFTLGDLSLESEEFALPLTRMELSPDLTDNDVDHNLELTFLDDGRWGGKITEIRANGVTLVQARDYFLEEGKLVLSPGGIPAERNEGNSILQSAGNKEIVVKALGYKDAVLTQEIKPGAPYQLVVSRQPVGPEHNKGVLAEQPIVEVHDQYGNVCTGVENIEVRAVPVGNPSWRFYNTEVPTAMTVNGKASFSGMQVLGSGGEIGNATIMFEISDDPLLKVESEVFTIPASIAGNVEGTITNPMDGQVLNKMVDVIAGTAYDIDSDRIDSSEIAIMTDTQYYLKPDGNWGTETWYDVELGANGEWSMALSQTQLNSINNQTTIRIILRISDYGELVENHKQCDEIIFSIQK